MLALRPKSVDFLEIWGGLEQSILKVIQLHNIDRKVWDGHFHDIYALCVAVPDPLADRLYDETKVCLENHVTQLHKQVSNEGEEALLECYFKHWTVYYKGAQYIHHLFLYLNNQHIKRQRLSDSDLTYGGLTIEPYRDNMMEIGELALDIWKRKMIDPLEGRIIPQLLNAIAADRRDKAIGNQHVVHGISQSFVNVQQYTNKNQLSLYVDKFETKFLEATKEYYRSVASCLLAEYSCSEYMQKVLVLLDEETHRSRKYLHATSLEKVTKMCQCVMVEAHQDRLHSVSRDLVEQEKSEDLTNMYTLLKPIPQGLSVLVKEFQSYVKKLGLDSVHSLKGENMAQQFVENILGVYRKFNSMVENVFRNDNEFFGAVDKALLTAVNYKDEAKSCPKASEWLAKYTDLLLRKCAKGLTEQEIDEKLAMAIVIFRYIEDKDVFQKFYSRMLAQRLIHSLSVSMDAEELMINKLKQACGYEFTSKLSRMYTDIGLSRDLTTKFVDNLTSEDRANVNMQIQVLQAGAWPMSSQSGLVDFVVPTELQQSVSLFETFYYKSYNGRKLTWLFNLATAELKLMYLDKIYLVTMSVQQMVVLLYFNQIVEDQATFAALMEWTRLSKDVLLKMLRSILDAGLLTCEHLEMTKTSVLKLNTTFSSKRLKFKLTAPVVQKQVEKEAESVNTTVQQDRKYFIECTIVRIMKTRKVLKHNSLIQEVIVQSRARFTPDVTFIKKVIESLIEKQYLQRTENHDEYAYLA